MAASFVRQRWFVFLRLTTMAMLVVVSLGLLIPCVLQVIELSRRETCADNLRRLALAAHDYHSRHERLPPDWLGPNYDAPSPNLSAPASYAGVLTFLLPHLGNDSLHKELWINWDLWARTDTSNIDPRTKKPYVPPATEYWWLGVNPAGRSHWELAKTSIKTFLCPTDDSWRAERVIVGIHIFGNNAPNDFIHWRSFSRDDAGAGELGRTNYLGVAGAGGRGSKNSIPGAPPGFTWGLYEGVFGNRGNYGPHANIPDGGNILLLGETAGGMEPSPDGERRTSFSWFVGALPTLHGLTGPQLDRWDTFGSRHRNVVQFVRGDGALVRLRRGETMVPQSNDWWVLQEMAGKRDGGTRATSTLVE